MKPGPRPKRETRSARVPAWMLDRATEIAEAENITTAEAFERFWGSGGHGNPVATPVASARPQAIDPNAYRLPGSTPVTSRLDELERQQRGLAVGIAGLFAGQRVIARRGNEDEHESAVRDAMSDAFAAVGLSKRHELRVLDAWDRDSELHDDETPELEPPDDES